MLELKEAVFVEKVGYRLVFLRFFAQNTGNYSLKNCCANSWEGDVMLDIRSQIEDTLGCLDRDLCVVAELAIFGLLVILADSCGVAGPTAVNCLHG